MEKKQSLKKTPNVVEKSPSLSDSPSPAKLIGKSPWDSYHKRDEKKLRKLKLASAKVIFFLEEAEQRKYLVSRKKHLQTKSLKDNKWEFLGGKLDKKEVLLTALIREVEEEEDSHILSEHIKKIAKKDLSAIKYKIVPLKDGSLHAIFLINLENKLYEKLTSFYRDFKATNYETYGLELVEEKFLSVGKKYAQNIELWTPKSIKILKALKRT